MIPAEWLQYAPKPRPLTNGNEWNVFLSYRSVNRTWVLNLYDVLTELGFKVFIDQIELTAGDLLITRLGNALTKSQSGILIWSDAAADSVWVAQEYQRLESKATKNPDFKFVPVRLDSTELPEFADNRIFIDFSSYPDGPNGGELLRLVHGIVGQALSPEAARFADQQNEIAADAADEITAAILNKDPEEIVNLFEQGGLAWYSTPSLGCKAGDSLIKLGQYTDAIRILEQLEQRFPKSIRPRQLLALALARRGQGDDLKNAQRILAKMYARGERDPETLGIYARTWMDRYAASNDITHLEQARNYYAEAFERAPDDYYTGINAASKSIFLGTPEAIEAGRQYAQRVQEITGNQAISGNYWKTATVAEILLIQKQYDEAGRMYRKAVDMAINETGSHQSTWQQAYRLLEKLGATEAEKTAALHAFKHLSPAS